MAPGVFTTWNNRGLGWGALRQGGGGVGQAPPEGSPKTTQHQQEKLQIRQKWGHHSKVLIYRHCMTSGEGGPPDGTRHGHVAGRWAGPGAVQEDKASAPLSPPSPPRLRGAQGWAPVCTILNSLLEERGGRPCWAPAFLHGSSPSRGTRTRGSYGSRPCRFSYSWLGASRVLLAETEFDWGPPAIPPPGHAPKPRPRPRGLPVPLPHPAAAPGRDSALHSP